MAGILDTLLVQGLVVLGVLSTHKHLGHLDDLAVPSTWDQPVERPSDFIWIQWDNDTAVAYIREEL